MPDNTSANSAPKLLDQVRGKIHLKHYSIRTEQAYLDWIKRFIMHFDKMHPKNLGVPPGLSNKLFRLWLASRSQSNLIR